MIPLIQHSVVTAFLRDLFKGHKAVSPTPLTARPVVDPLSIPAYKRAGIDIAATSQKNAA